MITTIVTGVDGSDTAGDAAHTAAWLATSLGARLIVLSAYTDFQVHRIQAGSDEFVYTSEGDARLVAESTATALRAEFGDLTVEAMAAEGKPQQALVRVAEEVGAQLIVVGNKRVQGLGSVLGSVAREVTQHATCDVYVAHTHHRRHR
ncbi:universal stress protein [Nocardioides sp. zg-579]|uniref:Universal stress protein n=1 Tax=Nocardioides marmotae TaxID=2663857 RepID=A0A6I3J7D0_9ACTN|nr:universal stress protein [Nocardioides marmotae]MCR6030237.1 universal stress protein [Gordonia jinghuaiqii]MTB93869.1 universal stress protein [Nocardioides marmotae]QKE00192.1 universal stress protein [Nocardioides marmotae]